MSRVSENLLKENFAQFHQIFINVRKKESHNSHKTEQADNPLPGYVTVITQVCIVFVLSVLSKR